ncbi:MAG: hypothetical protein F4066_04670 [Chloroflexi bacterium]|nr:hypothetical protein [Chloroflexota bacterium]MYF80546.1 hypothetical protein [Chloroflexota bacterium]MYI04137.1 hypothetical protein [Chloroflexota bacterium]
MQFRQRDKDAIARGALTVTFRRWRRPQAKAGGRYRVGTHVIEVTSVEQVEAGDISVADARAAGHDSPQAALDAIRANQRSSGDPDAPLYRIGFRSLGPKADPRAELAADDHLKPAEVAELTARLGKMDARSQHGAWIHDTLEAIDAAPGRRAAELAAAQQRETAKFKTDVRKLKKLGLTISLEVGYRLSPRGRVVLDALRRPQPATTGARQQSPSPR